MLYFPQNNFSNPTTSPLLGASQGKGYGAVAEAALQESTQGDFQGVPIREINPSKIPSILKLLSDPVNTVITAGDVLHHAIKLVAEYPPINHLLLAPQLKKEWKRLYRHPFATRCSHDRCSMASNTDAAPEKTQQQIYYRFAEAACNTIIDSVAEEAAKYATSAGKVGSLEKASLAFQSKEIARLALSKAFGSYYTAFKNFDESAFGHQSSTTSANDQAVLNAIQGAAKLMGKHWAELLKAA